LTKICFTFEFDLFTFRILPSELSLADFLVPSPDLTDEAAMEASDGTRAIVPDDLCNKN